MALLNHLFALAAHGDEGLHHGRGVGDAEIDKVLDPEAGGRADGLAAGNQVHGAKQSSLRWRWVRHSYQVNEGIAGTNELAVSAGVERIAGYHFAPGREPGFRVGTNQRSHAVAALKEDGNQAIAEISRPSRDEHMAAIGRERQALHFEQQPDIGKRRSHAFSTLPGKDWIPISSPRSLIQERMRV